MFFHFLSKCSISLNQWQRKIEYFKNCIFFDNNWIENVLKKFKETEIKRDLRYMKLWMRYVGLL